VRLELGDACARRGAPRWARAELGAAAGRAWRWPRRAWLPRPPCWRWRTRGAPRGTPGPGRGCSRSAAWRPRGGSRSTTWTAASTCSATAASRPAATRRCWRCGSACTPCGASSARSPASTWASGPPVRAPLAPCPRADAAPAPAAPSDCEHVRGCASCVSAVRVMGCSMCHQAHQAHCKTRPCARPWLLPGGLGALPCLQRRPAPAMRAA